MEKEHPLSPERARLVRMLNALGNPVRLQIIDYLAECGTCITGQIVERTPLAQSTVSQHLKVLREAELVEGEIEGPATCYCINRTSFTWLRETLSSWSEQCCSQPGGDCGKPTKKEKQ